MKPRNRKIGARLRIVLAPEIAIGPGKADLLDGIAQAGSIAAAGRQLGMSYRRAWTLIEIMNTDFGTPLVVTSKGGNARGGAELTTQGKKVLSLYRRIQSKADKAISSDIKALQRLLPRTTN